MSVLSKTCKECGEHKPLPAFYPRYPSSTGGKDYSGSLAGVSACCRICVKARAAERRKRLGVAHVNYMKNIDLRRKYGIGLEDFNKMFAEQRGRCAICERHQTEFARGLVVDHDHKTGAIRKLLCPNCNAAIGMLGENMVLFARAVEYLQTHASGVCEPTASGKVAENGAEKGHKPMH